MKSLISIIVPVYNEEENIAACYSAISELSAELSAYEFEFIFTDNHSSDETFSKLRDLHAIDERIRVYRFSKNYGYQRSIMTGYLHARGDAVVQLDCDLQDPPQMIKEFLAKWELGYKVVYGVRKDREEGKAINLLRKIFYRTIGFLGREKIPNDAGDFRLVDRALIDHLRQINDGNPYIRGMIHQLGYKQIGIGYARSAREAGESKFDSRALIGLAIDALFNHTDFPLRASAYFGIFVAVLTLIGSILYIGVKSVGGEDWPAGFATIVVILLFSTSFNALFLGILGEYVGRIYSHQKNFPLTTIESSLESETPPDRTAQSAK